MTPIHGPATSSAPTTSHANALAHVSIQIRDLPRDFLGFASPTVVWIDTDAASYGWSIEASSRMDLFSAVTHDLG